MNWLEREERLTYRRADAAMDVWLGWLTVAFELQEGYSDQFSRSNGIVFIHCQVTIVRFSLDITTSSTPRKALWASFLITGAEVTSLCVSPGFQMIVHYSGIESMRLEVVSKMVELETPANSVSVGHGQLQHADASCNRKQVMRYCNLVKSKGPDLKYAVVIAYGASPAGDSMLLGPDEGEASGFVSNESNPTVPLAFVSKTRVSDIGL